MRRLLNLFSATRITASVIKQNKNELLVFQTKQTFVHSEKLAAHFVCFTMLAVTFFLHPRSFSY